MDWQHISGTFSFDNKMKEFSKVLIKTLCWTYIIIGVAVSGVYMYKYVIDETATFEQIEYILNYFKDPFQTGVLVYLAKSAFENYHKYKNKNTKEN